MNLVSPLTRARCAACRTGFRALLMASAVGSSVGPVEASWIPDSWGGAVSVGWEDRSSSDNDPIDPEQGTGDGRYWFARQDDIAFRSEVWARWKFSSLHRKARAKVLYGRSDWAHGVILGQQLFRVALAQELTKHDGLSLEVSHSPQLYSRHRADKDARAGEPEFRPEAYTEWESEVAFEHEWSPAVSSMVFLNVTSRDATQWFAERDQDRTGFGVSIPVEIGGALTVQSTYEHGRNTARNEPDLGSDRSYREHVLDLDIRVKESHGWQVELGARAKLRSYTTNNPEDNRFDREDRYVGGSVELSRSWSRARPFITVEGSRRNILSVSELQQADLDDDESDHWLARLGLSWSSR